MQPLQHAHGGSLHSNYIGVGESGSLASERGQCEASLSLSPPGFLSVSLSLGGEGQLQERLAQGVGG